jgi:hypothetical protein
MWSVWDKTSDIDGYSAEYYFKTFNHLKNEETIYLKTVDGVVTNIEGKNILASMFGIDPTLPDDAFIAEYERILAEPVEEENKTEITE